jgi:hypothetical protein
LTWVSFEQRIHTVDNGEFQLSLLFAIISQNLEKHFLSDQSKNFPFLPPPQSKDRAAPLVLGDVNPGHFHFPFATGEIFFGFQSPPFGLSRSFSGLWGGEVGGLWPNHPKPIEL